MLKSPYQNEKMINHGSVILKLVKFKSALVASVAISALTVFDANAATTLEELAKKLEMLAAENAALRSRVEQLESAQGKPAAPAVQQANVAPVQAAPASNADAPAQTTSDVGSGFVRFNNEYSYKVLDATTNINRKQQLILENKKSGNLAEDSLYLSAGVTAIADYQWSNTQNKFGYLMRHPTANNQQATEVSEAVIHSAQFAITGNVGDWVTAYAELLYDPQQSFGAGTITDLTRNQVQLRRGYVMFGNLEKSPVYLSLGKMAVPFGLTDTVNPFTASTVWHAFGGLAYGVHAGYSQDGLNINLMGVQGGAQFRAAHVPVNGTNIPSKLNNFAVNASYTFNVADDTTAMFGASYIKGSPYCQGFPIVHFQACDEANGAYDIYAQIVGSNWLIQGEFAETDNEWPGTFNPTIPQFAASKVNSWAIGGKYTVALGNTNLDISGEFSRFKSGPDGSPWERQDQWVLGLANFITPSAKVFGEFIHIDGYAPLNFLSGGNLGPGVTHSEAGAKTDIVLIGVNAAF